MSARTVTLTPEQRERLLRDIWIAHDGRWFVKTVQELGFEVANKLNHAVIRSLGKTEIKRLMAEANVGEIKNTQDFRALLEVACDLYMPEDHKYEIEILGDNSLAGRVLQCYVFQNVSKAGATAFFRCAAQSRFAGWVEACGLQGEVIAEKNTESCNGTCDIIFKINKW